VAFPGLNALHFVNTPNAGTDVHRHHAATSASSGGRHRGELNIGKFGGIRKAWPSR
jgi:hypothetical protein